jgi:hypothetical protein
MLNTNIVLSSQITESPHVVHIACFTCACVTHVYFAPVNAARRMHACATDTRLHYG